MLVERWAPSPTMNAGLFAFSTPNLGDDLQSFAALAHLGRVHELIDRDRMADAKTLEDTACVFNSWFLLGSDFRVPPPRLSPLWHGFSAAGKEVLVRRHWRDYLRDHAPIGCRDLYTRDLLLDAGVDAHWTGCLTMFLGGVIRPETRTREGVYFVDLPQAAEPLVPPSISARATRLSMFPTSAVSESPLKRWATVARLVQRLANAELVVTRRLHVALPCVSFRTPVVTIPDAEIAWARQRFSGFTSVLRPVFLDDALAGSAGIDWQNPLPSEPPEALTRHHHALLTTLRSLGIAGHPRAGSYTLDDPACQEQLLSSLSGSPPRGRIRLRLRDRVFDLAVHSWTERCVAVRLAGFPGLSKFEFEVETRPPESGAWTTWGLLRELNDTRLGPAETSAASGPGASPITAPIG